MSKCWFVLLMFFSGFALADSVNVKKLNKAKWHAVTTENFYILTDAGEKKGALMARELERFRFFVSQILGYEQRPQSEKIVLFLAKSTGTFSAFGINDKFAGLYVGRAEGVTFFANAKKFTSSDTGRPNIGRQIILHELVHMLMHNSEIRDQLALPTWYNEGIAEYFATYVEKRGKIYLGSMGLVGNRMYSLWQEGRGLELINIQELLSAGYHDRIESDSGKDRRYVEKFYARSFALVHYLNSSPERRLQLRQYLYALKKGFPVDESFKAVFEVSYADIDAEVDKYLNGKFVSARVFPMGGDGVVFPEFSVKANKISSREALERLIPWLQMISSAFISDEDKQRMYEDLEKIYPDFFKS